MSWNFPGGPALFLLWPLVTWAVAVYIALRFLRAFERGVRAHERIADAMTRVPPGAAGLPSSDRSA